MRPLSTTRRFTLIELLVVIAIIVTLTALLAMGLGSSRDKAANKATRALVQKVKTALESYNSEFRDYPPDGYDAETGWTVTASGVSVGYGAEARNLRGTSALIYFLCRPVIKVTRVGSDPDPNEPRNIQRKRVGPFLDLKGDEFSRREFNPNYPWKENSYWGSPANNKDCEIIDAYGRPLVYDKVKTVATHYQVDRFQNSSPGSDKGYKVHPDQVYMTSEMSLTIEAEPQRYGALDDAVAILKNSTDPRYKAGQMDALINELEKDYSAGAYTIPTAADTTHAPKNLGGYDLWSVGKSWIDPRDDITSWGE